VLPIACLITLSAQLPLAPLGLWPFHKNAAMRPARVRGGRHREIREKGREGGRKVWREVGREGRQVEKNEQTASSILTR